MTIIFDIFGTLFLFLPPWFALFVGVTLATMMIIALWRLIAFVIEVIPFI